MATKTIEILNTCIFFLCFWVSYPLLPALILLILPSSVLETLLLLKDTN